MRGVDVVRDETVGVVGRDLIVVPNATVGVVARGVKLYSRRFEEDDNGVGVLRPDKFDDELLRRFVRFRFPLDPATENRKLASCNKMLTVLMN